MILKFLFLFQLAWSASFELGPDGYRAGGKIRVNAISESQAARLFKKFDESPEIAHQYYAEGCFARAYLMTKMAEERQIEMGRATVVGILRGSPRHNPKISGHWQWHVAPVVYVMKNGKPVLTVFDPTLFDRPVTEAEWLAAMSLPGDPPPSVTSKYYGSRFQLFNNTDEKKKSAWQKIDLEKAKALMSEFNKYPIGEYAPAGMMNRIEERIDESHRLNRKGAR